MTTAFAAVDRAAQPIPLTRLVRVELRKLIDTRAGFWLIAVMGLITVVVAGVQLAVGGNDPAGLSYGNFFGTMNIPTGIILPIMAILLVTSEWSQRNALTTFTMEPRRERIVVAKLLASLVAAIAAVVFSLIVGAVANVIAGVVVGDGAGAWDLTASGLGYAFVLQVCGLLLGFGFAALFLSTPAAIVAYFVLPTIISLVSNLVPWIKEHLADWIDTGRVSEPFLSSGGVSGAQWAHFLVAYGLWIGVPMALGVWRILRSEVK
ncbi:MAG: ABC transporter permease [Gordonia sp. (in: high G+C Gram-positive bacteria)]|uniref:ABC transporter permease n=1 Tax=Gordonia TaxID=2053 RepID=UPI0032670123